VRACVPQVRRRWSGWAGERRVAGGCGGVWVGLVGVWMYMHMWWWCGVVWYWYYTETGGRSRTLLRRRTVFRRRAWAIWFSGVGSMMSHTVA
jgi:hypothetical protein